MRVFAAIFTTIVAFTSVSPAGILLSNYSESFPTTSAHDIGYFSDPANAKRKFRRLFNTKYPPLKESYYDEKNIPIPPDRCDGLFEPLGQSGNPKFV